jgi:hypothetical protein
VVRRGLPAAAAAAATAARHGELVESERVLVLKLRREVLGKLQVRGWFFHRRWAQCGREHI